MILKIEELTKRFGSRKILDSVSLEINKGEVFCLCGESGSGKTTLVRAISGLVPFDEGSVQLGETRVKALGPYPRDLFGRVGVIFQDHNLFPHMTARQNVQLGLRKVRGLSKQDAGDRAVSEMERLGLGHRLDAYPAELSGGERKRVAIARALAMDPLILILDEPTADLDPSRIEDVLALMADLAGKQTTMMLVTHNIQFGRAAGDHFAVLEDGHVTVSRESSLLDRLERRLT